MTGNQNNTLKQALPGINKQLRKKFDSDDPIRTAVRIGGLRRSGGKRGSRQVPVWTQSTVAVRKVLLLAFPKLKTDPVQRQRAARWAQMIFLYWGRQLTQGQIGMELGMSQFAVNSEIRNIKRAAAGCSVRSGKPRGRRGRPRKIRALSAASVSSAEGSHEIR